MSCDCGKVIRQESDDQPVVDVQEHAPQVHGMELTQDQALVMAEPVPGAGP